MTGLPEVSATERDCARRCPQPPAPFAARHFRENLVFFRSRLPISKKRSQLPKRVGYGLFFRKGLGLCSGGGRGAEDPRIKGPGPGLGSFFFLGSVLLPFFFAKTISHLRDFFLSYARPAKRLSHSGHLRAQSRSVAEPLAGLSMR